MSVRFLSALLNKLTSIFDFIQERFPFIEVVQIVVKEEDIWLYFTGTAT